MNNRIFLQRDILLELPAWEAHPARFAPDLSQWPSTWKSFKEAFLRPENIPWTICYLFANERIGETVRCICALVVITILRTQWKISSGATILFTSRSIRFDICWKSFWFVMANALVSAWAANDSCIALWVWTRKSGSLLSSFRFSDIFLMVSSLGCKALTIN